MRIVLDSDKCVGHGRCYTLEPQLFEPDDEGHCLILHVAVEGDQVAGAVNAVANCPEGALVLESDGQNANA